MPDEHWLPSVQGLAPFSAQLPAALQARPAAQPPCLPTASSPHVPPAHVLQGPVQDAAQQKSSTEQKPDEHWLPIPMGHACPFTATQAAAALQTLLAMHPPSRPAVTGAQVPVAHELQGPVQASPQQNWSAPEEQMPEAHSAPVEHPCPFTSTHVPPASQT
jgi:hypothetical protein